MQYSFAKACLLALATTTTVLSQIVGFNVLTAPASHEVLKAGEKFTIKWAPSDPAAPISLVLMQGKDAQHLELASDFIAKSVDSASGNYEWSVPADATFAAYGIKLELDSDPEQFQYSNPFTIAGGSGGGASGSDSGEGEATISISSSEPSQTGEPTTKESGKSTTTIQVSQISTAPTTSATKALSTSTKPEPTSTSTTSTSTSASEEPTSTEESTTAAPSTTEAPSTTLETSIAPPTSTEAPTTPPSAIPNGAAPHNAVVGSGLLGAMVMVFALF